MPHRQIVEELLSSRGGAKGAAGETKPPQPTRLLVQLVACQQDPSNNLVSLCHKDTLCKSCLTASMVPGAVAMVLCCLSPPGW